MTKIKDLRSMGKEELNSKLDELKKEMIKNNAQIATGTTPKNPGQIREIKKTIARILTIVNTEAKNKEASVHTPKKSMKKTKKQTGEKING